MTGSNGNLIYDVATWLIPLIFAIVFHEVAHGYAARALGDETAARRGRLTLNPIAHVDPVGTVLLPMMLAVAHAPIFGWAKPVPVNALRLRQPRRDMMLVGLAGPLSNLAMAVIAALLLSIVLGWSHGVPVDGLGRFIVDNLANFLVINVFLAIFNLLPVPPFDGGHVVAGLLPERLARGYDRLGRYALPIMLVLLLVLPAVSPQADVVRHVVAPIANAITSALAGFAALG